MSETDPIDTTRLETLLTDLVGIYSPSGKEGAICDFLLDYFHSSGVAVECQPVDDERYNLIVRPRRGEPALLLLGHVDTVTASAADQYQPKLEDGDLVGLGTADMKGGCAAMIEAYLNAYEAREGEIPAMLALVVGEEENGDGTAAMLQYGCPPFAIVGEPTDLAYCAAHYGYLEVQLETIGVKRHAAEATREHNAVYSMLRILERLTRFLDEQHGDLICNIRDLQSSTAGFAVADRCACWMDLHLPPGRPPATLAKEIRSIVEAEGDALPGTVSAPEFPTCHAGYLLPDGDPLEQAMRAVCDEQGRAWKSAAFRSHSDANLLWQAGCKPAVLGPGRLSYAHATNERVPVQQVLDAAMLYRGLIERF